MTTIYWQDIDIKPVDGDPAAVRTLATTFRSVEERSRTVAQRLSSIASALGPHLWTGPGADAFAHVASGVQPSAAQLADSHGEAGAALTDYANALESAQDAVERAAEAETRAMQDRQVARADRAAAEADIADQVRAQSDANFEIKVCDANRILYFYDSAYIAQLADYENDLRLRISIASNQEYEARGYRDAAVSAEQDAEFQMALARGSADDAHQARDQAAIVCVKRLHAVTPTAPKVPVLLDTILKIAEIPGLANLFGGGSPLGKLIGGFENMPGMGLLSALGDISDIYSIYQDAEDARRKWQEHDQLGAVTDGMDGVGVALRNLGLKLFEKGGPGAWEAAAIMYLSGAALSLAADDISVGREIDWNDLPSLSEVWKYAPSSAWGSVTTILEDIL